MRRNGKKWMALLGLVFAAAVAVVSYGAQSGPGMDLVTAADGRTVREEAQSLGAPGQSGGADGTGAEAAASMGAEDRDVLTDPEITGDTDKILVVRGQGGASVWVAYYREESGAWSQVFGTEGVWGLNGCTDDKREGDKKTPCGVYHFNQAFGILDDPGAVLPYHKVTEDDYWVDDPDSRHYNRMVNASQVEKDWNSAEHLIQVSPYYNYALSLTYNEEAVPGKGSAIFLHCTAEGYPGSSGCICIPEPEMKTILCQADERTKIVILEN